MVNLENYERIIAELLPYNAKLVAVSKTKSPEDIRLLLNKGQKAFGENYIQELTDKQKILSDAEWHFIGHLQSNKVKQLSSFVALIHGIDSVRLLRDVNKYAGKENRIQNCLLQVHIAQEETKFGFSFDDANSLLNGNELKTLKNISVKGLMGMASLTEDRQKIRNEFKMLRNFFDKQMDHEFSILSMGMTNDYKIALEEGSTMVRIGSAIFGERN